MRRVVNGTINSEGGGSSHKVLVIGDLILDKYISGRCSRISPEAPVPVVVEEKTEYRAGGAANVALNLKALGVDCALVGITGRDDEARILMDLVGDIPTHFQQEDIPTTLKTRFLIDGHHALGRIDRESVGEFKDILKYVSGHIGAGTDVVIVSDYGKHFKTAIPIIIREAVARGAHVIVDPQSDDWVSYAGATTVTPNLKEISGEVYGDKAVESMYWLRMRYDIENILVTRGGDGLFHSSSDGCVEDVPEKSEVVDATGAGDTVVAAFAAGVLAELSNRDCLRFANAAAGDVCRKKGTAVVDESFAPWALDGWFDYMTDKTQRKKEKARHKHRDGP